MCDLSILMICISLESLYANQKLQDTLLPNVNDHKTILKEMINSGVLWQTQPKTRFTNLGERVRGQILKPCRLRILVERTQSRFADLVPNPFPERL